MEKKIESFKLLDNLIFRLIYGLLKPREMSFFYYQTVISPQEISNKWIHL